MVVAAQTSGAAKLVASSTSIMYHAASATSLQSNVNGCATGALSAGLDERRGARRRRRRRRRGRLHGDRADGRPGARRARRVDGAHAPEPVAVGQRARRELEAVVLALRISGAPNCEISSTWIVYEPAPATSVQSNVTGCATTAPSAGLTSAGAAGSGRRRWRRRRGRVDVDLGHEGVAPEDHRVAAQRAVERAGRRREVGEKVWPVT